MGEATDKISTSNWNESDTTAPESIASGSDVDFEEDAEQMFTRLMPTEECPEWFNESDWLQMKLIRDQWL